MPYKRNVYYCGNIRSIAWSVESLDSFPFKLVTLSEFGILLLVMLPVSLPVEFLSERCKHLYYLRNALLQDHSNTLSNDSLTTSQRRILRTRR